ncbi:MAG: Alpha-1,4-glucan:maltose-1-phosphate maltosyltransferase [Mycoplasmataceae bacterium]|nr:MAG: Alpha-1,4-glucan:maltose-1-phosphate maltosyltransferase [Mycoplasmataceae bacterium]
MEVKEFFELFFVIAAMIATPVIVMASYFSVFPKLEYRKDGATFFLIISIIYALSYTYFAWKSIKRDNSSYNRIIVEKKKKDENNKDK